VLVALADADRYHVTVIPGRGFASSRVRLDERIRALFEPAAATRTGERQAAPEAIRPQVPREPAYAKH